MHGAEFKAANNVLLGVLKLQKRAGKDHTKSHQPISESDMHKLMMKEDGVFSRDDPQELQDLVWFSLQFYLCRRGCEGVRELRKDSFKFIPAHDNQPEYVTLNYNEASKNHPGGLEYTNDPQRRMHATGGPLCPVEALRVYLRKLHPGCDALYQRVNPKGKVTGSGSWYLPAPLGVKKLQNMMSRLSEKANLSQKYTNHCLRAACIKTLMDRGYDPITVTRLSGHRNVASVMSYCRDTTDEVKRQMGECLTSALHGTQCPALPSTIRRPAITAAVDQPSSSSSSLGNSNCLQLLPSSSTTAPSSTTSLQEARQQSITVQSHRQQNAMSSSLFSNCTITIGSFNMYSHNK